MWLRGPNDEAARLPPAEKLVHAHGPTTNAQERAVDEIRCKSCRRLDQMRFDLPFHALLLNSLQVPQLAFLIKTLASYQ